MFYTKLMMTISKLNIASIEEQKRMTIDEFLLIYLNINK